jgi:hypothetical protein
MFLRHQLLILRRSAPPRLRLRTADRLIFVWLYRLFPSLLGAAIIFKPETLVRWHRSGFRLYWRWKSRRRVGRPEVPTEIRDLVRTISRDRDTAYGVAVTCRLRAMGIRDRPISPRSPWQNGHVERLIGSIRRECLDHVVALGERHVRDLLTNHQTYYNGARTHLALDKDALFRRPPQTETVRFTMSIRGPAPPRPSLPCCPARPGKRWSPRSPRVSATSRGRLWASQRDWQACR